MRDREVEFDSAGYERPDGENSHRFDDRIAEKDLFADSFVKEAINSAAKLRGDLNTQEIILEHNHAELARDVGVAAVSHKPA